MDIGFLIDGEERGAASGATYDRNDPYTGKLATRAAAAGVADATAAVAAAAAAFKSWSKSGPGERRAILMKAADVMESKVVEFTRLMIEEIGGTVPWVGFNVMLAAGMLREAGAMTTQIAGAIGPALVGMALLRHDVATVYTAWGLLMALCVLGLLAVPRFKEFLSLGHDEIVDWYRLQYPAIFK